MLITPNNINSCHKDYFSRSFLVNILVVKFMPFNLESESYSVLLDFFEAHVDFIQSKEFSNENTGVVRSTLPGSSQLRIEPDFPFLQKEIMSSVFILVSVTCNF